MCAQVELHGINGREVAVSLLANACTRRLPQSGVTWRRDLQRITNQEDIDVTKAAAGRFSSRKAVDDIVEAKVTNEAILVNDIKVNVV